MAGQPKSFRPEDGTARRLAQQTVVPPFDPGEYARESETILAEDPGERQTTPPEASYAVLRDSYASQAVLRAKPLAIEDAADKLPSHWQSQMRVLPELPPLTVVPTLIVTREDLEWFDLVPEERVLAQRCDGEASIATLAARSGIDDELAQRAIRRLAEEGIVELR